MQKTANITDVDNDIDVLDTAETLVLSCVKDKKIINEIQKKNAKIAHKKLTEFQWVQIEKKNNPHEKIVGGTMIKLGKLKKGDHNVENFVDHNLIVCDEMLYLQIRAKFIVHGFKLITTVPIDTTFVETKDKKKKNKNDLKKKGITKEEIMANNAKGRLMESVESLLVTFTQNRLNSDGLNKTNIIELRGLTLIYMAEYALGFNQRKELINEELAYKLIQTIKFIIEKLSNNQFDSMVDRKKINVSPTLMSDLRFVLATLKTTFKFSERKIFEKYYELTDKNNYFKVLPDFVIKPYEDQIALLTTIRDNPEFLILYTSIFGRGKTTITGAICSYLLQNRHNEEVVAIYACSVETVRHTVGRLAYNCDIPFAIATKGNGILKVTNHYSCRHRAGGRRGANRQHMIDRQRILIISDLDSAYELIAQEKKSSTPKQYLLFLDEPTHDADQTNSIITETVAKILSVAPKKTILASATMPAEKYIPEITQRFKTTYPNALITTVNSMQIPIGCQVTNFNNGEIIAPHYGCQNVDELNKVIVKIQTNQFLGRLYTANMLYLLDSEMQKHKITDMPNIDQEFASASDMTHDTIKDVALKMLFALTKCDDVTITNVCNAGIISSTSINQKIDFSKLGTTEAYKFIGNTLFVTNDPVERARQCFAELIKNSPTSSEILKKYQADLELAKKKVEKLKKAVEKEETSEDIKNQKLQKFIDTNAVYIDFPEVKQINTVTHIEKYSPHIINRVNHNIIKKLIDLETLPLTSDDPDDVILLLFHGIGIYETGSKHLSDAYLNHVLYMASNGLLSYVISDDSISYGTNYPFNHVMIDDSAMDKHSISTLFQLMGRSGRIGQSWIAYIHLDTNTCQRLIDYIKQNDDDHVPIEAINLQLALNKIPDATIISPTERWDNIYIVDDNDDDSDDDDDSNENIIKLSDVEKIKTDEAKPIVTDIDDWFDYDVEEEKTVVKPDVILDDYTNVIPDSCPEIDQLNELMKTELIKNQDNKKIPVKPVKPPRKVHTVNNDIPIKQNTSSKYVPPHLRKK